MTWRNTAARFGSLSIGLHWLMLLFIVCVYAAINLHDVAAKGSALRADAKIWHFGFGLSVLVLVAVRLLVLSISGPAPAIEPTASRWQVRLASAMHVALYAFMVGMPLLGWFAVSAKGDPILILGTQLPALIGHDKALYGTLKEIHQTVGTVGYWLIGLHAAAALLHHYGLRDNTLRRMLPARWGTRTRPTD